MIFFLSHMTEESSDKSEFLIEFHLNTNREDLSVNYEMSIFVCLLSGIKRKVPRLYI